MISNLQFINIPAANQLNITEPASQPNSQIANLANMTQNSSLSSD
jgi:hypothetical protein